MRKFLALLEQSDIDFSEEIGKCGCCFDDIRLLDLWFVRMTQEREGGGRKDGRERERERERDHT